MSKKEDNSTIKQIPHTSQRKLSSNKQRTATEISSDRRLRTESGEDFRSKTSRTERSFSTEDANIIEKHSELTKQVKAFYEKFLDFTVTEDNKDKLAKVIKDDREEDPIQLTKSMNQIIKALSKTLTRDKSKIVNSSLEEKQRNDYEELLQKAENDIRQHIRIEQQLKLLIDNMQAKLDEYEKNQEEENVNEIKDLLKDTKTDNAKLLDTIKQKDQELSNFQKALKQKEQTIRTYEEKVLTITILEHKLASLNEKYQKEKEGIRGYYEQEFANLTKEIQHMHRVLAINIPLDEKMKLLQEELLSYKDFNTKKVLILENKLKQLEDNIVTVCDKDDTETDFALHTDPGHGDRRLSVRPSTTATSVLKSRGYDISSHRCSTEVGNKSVENRSANHKPSSAKKRTDTINQVQGTPILSARKSSKDKIKVEQPQQAPKTQRDVENYFQYIKKRLDNIQGNDTKEKEHLRSFDARRSSSMMKGAYLAGSACGRREKSSDKVSRADTSRGIDDRTECFSSERQQRKSVPKLRAATNTLHTRIFKI